MYVARANRYNVQCMVRFTKYSLVRSRSAFTRTVIFPFLSTLCDSFIFAASSLSIVRDPWVPARSRRRPHEAVIVHRRARAFGARRLTRRVSRHGPEALEKGGAKLKKAGMAAVAVKGAKGGK